MSISLKEATEFMISSGYIHPLGRGKYKLSTKFHQEIGKALSPFMSHQEAIAQSELHQGLAKICTAGTPATILGPDGIRNAAAQSGSGVVPDKFYFSWENRYKQFILAAKIPAKLDNNRGENYQVNAYSEKGMKAYRKACESGIDHDLLVKSTMLYYHSRIRFKVAIGRYMEEGIWKTGYDALKDAAEQGETQLIDHIKAETQDDQQSSYRVG